MAEMTKINIAKRIKEYRSIKSVTQEQFGAIIGVSAQAISKWEREECYPDITFLPILADILSCSVNDFFEK